MGNFTQTFMHESEFDGDKIRVELRRLKRKHVAKLSPFISQHADGAMRLTFDQQMPLLAVLEEILPECIANLEGLKDRGNNALKIGDIIEDVYFMPLFSEWLTALLTNSFMRTPDEKKSEPLPPAAPSDGNAATN